MVKQIDKHMQHDMLQYVSIHYSMFNANNNETQNITNDTNFNNGNSHFYNSKHNKNEYSNGLSNIDTGGTRRGSSAHNHNDNHNNKSNNKNNNSNNKKNRRSDEAQNENLQPCFNYASITSTNTIFTKIIMAQTTRSLLISVHLLKSTTKGIVCQKRCKIMDWDFH